MRNDLKAEIDRWVAFVEPIVETRFSLLELIRDDDHNHRHKFGLWHLYSFWMLDDTPLKIGLAGPKSGPRFNSQHYNPNSSGSNLAKSLVASGLCNPPAKDWIIDNTYRINAVFDSFTGPLAHALEAHLHLVFKPRFER